MSRSARWPRGCLASLLLAACTGAPAAEPDVPPADPPVSPSVSPPEPPAAWRVDVGALGLAYPRFPGARDTRFLALPLVEARFGDDLIFATLRDGVGFVAWHRGGLEVGPVANLAFPRRESLQPAALHGLDEIGWTVETGGFARYTFNPLVWGQFEARQGLDGHKGLVADLRLELDAPPLLHDRLLLAVGPRAGYGNGRYARVNFGVTPAAAARSGYAAFRPADGWQVGGEASAVYAVDAHWALTAFADYARLAGDFGRSPLVRGPYGAAGQWTAGLVASYGFAF